MCHVIGILGWSRGPYFGETIACNSVGLDGRSLFERSEVRRDKFDTREMRRIVAFDSRRDCGLNCP